MSRRNSGSFGDIFKRAVDAQLDWPHLSDLLEETASMNTEERAEFVRAIRTLGKFGAVSVQLDTKEQWDAVAAAMLRPELILVNPDRKPAEMNRLAIDGIEVTCRPSRDT